MNVKKIFLSSGIVILLLIALFGINQPKSQEIIPIQYANPELSMPLTRCIASFFWREQLKSGKYSATYWTLSSEKNPILFEFWATKTGEWVLLASFYNGASCMISMGEMSDLNVLAQKSDPA